MSTEVRAGEAVVGSLFGVFRIDLWDAVLIKTLFGVVINELITIMIGSGVDMLSDIDIIVVTAAVIVLEFSKSVLYAAGVLAGVLINILAGGIIGAATGIGGGVLTGVNVTVCEAVKTDLKFVLTTPSEENFVPFWGAMLSC